MKESLGEKECRQYFEKRFKKKFIRCRPEWLNGLELDGYNEQLCLAFEYNGSQHYKYTPHFHKKDCNEFHKQVGRDVEKLKACANRNIRLIIIPNIPKSDIKIFLDIEFLHFKKKHSCIIM
jgi:hypothetical protein